MSRAGEGTYSMLAGFVRPRLGTADVLVLLWRAKWLMLAVFLPLLAAGLAGAALLPSQYTAETRLMVAQERSAMARAELELLRSPAVAHRALGAVTLARVYPEIARGCSDEGCARLAADEIAAHFITEAEAGSPLIIARYTHRQAAMSAEMLNAMVQSYLDYRADVFAGAAVEMSSVQQQRAEEELARAEAAIRDYLMQHELTDLAAERKTLQQLGRAARSELLQVQSRLRQARAQLAGYEAQLANIAPYLPKPVPSPASRSLAALKQEREEKLSRYLLDSRVIQDLNRRIAQAERDLADTPQTEGAADSVPNPLYQQVETSVSMLKADVRALRAQEAELSKQIVDFDARLRNLMQLVPELTHLQRRREVAEASLRAVSVQTSQSRIAANVGGEAVRVLEVATEPLKGESLRAPAALLALLVAAFASLMAGLGYAFTRRGLATPGAVQRTLGLSVAAAVPRY